jgi:hypothetical protein
MSLVKSEGVIEIKDIAMSSMLAFPSQNPAKKLKTEAFWDTRKIKLEWCTWVVFRYRQCYLVLLVAVAVLVQYLRRLGRC